MYMTAAISQQHKNRWTRYAAFFLYMAICMLVMIEPAFATGTGTGGSTAAQTRITGVATGWQNIVQGVGVSVLIIAWSYVGYMIAFAGKTMKDMFPTMVGTSIAGLAPVLVGWLFS
jgi:hypothetical protein